MTQKDEALKMAITNLEVLKESALRGNQLFTETADNTISACKAALSKPETVTLPDGWVSVEDAQPDDGVYVIAAVIKDNEIWSWDKARYSSTAKRWFDGNRPTSNYNYWQAAPKLNEKG